MKQCKIYSCPKRPGSPCCVDCPEKSCHFRCLNHYDRCRCSLDVKPRKQGQRKDTYSHQQIMELRASGMLVMDIADAVGCSKGTVLYHLARERNK